MHGVLTNQIADVVYCTLKYSVIPQTFVSLEGKTLNRKKNTDKQIFSHGLLINLLIGVAMSSYIWNNCNIAAAS